MEVGGETRMDPAPRPRSAAQTRERLLQAARREFARVGFAGAKVHAIAASAGVSPNLVTRYFGGKEGLFVAASEVRLGLDAILDGPRDALGRRLADAIVDRWVEIRGEDPLLALLRASGERAQAGRTLSTFLDGESLEPLRRHLLRCGLGPEQAAARAAAVDAFVLGVTARRRMLDDDLGDPTSLRLWLAATIQGIVDAARPSPVDGRGINGGGDATSDAEGRSEVAGGRRADEAPLRRPSTAAEA
jgi:AcrR family transcriptional regulator